MPQTRWLLAGAVVAVAAVALLLATFGRGDPRDAASASASAQGSAAGSGVASVTVSPSATATATPSVPPSPQPEASPAIPAPTPSRAPATAPPRASGPPRLAWAEFLAHLNEDRATVEGLNAALTTAAQAQDAAAVRVAAVDILDFVDVERDWLRDHPPADCYADAHAAATVMLDAYGTAADRFIDWTETGGGIGGLPALGDAVTAAEAARSAFATFVTALEATTCPT
jgi:hypothetical protein